MWGVCIYIYIYSISEYQDNIALFLDLKNKEQWELAMSTNWLLLGI